MTWSVFQLKVLFKVYKNYPEIYDASNKDFKNFPKNQTALRKIVSTMELFRPNTTKDDVLEQLHEYRTQYKNCSLDLAFVKVSQQKCRNLKTKLQEEIELFSDMIDVFKDECGSDKTFLIKWVRDTEDISSLIRNEENVPKPKSHEENGNVSFASTSTTDRISGETSQSKTKKNKNAKNTSQTDTLNHNASTPIINQNTPSNSIGHLSNPERIIAGDSKLLNKFSITDKDDWKKFTKVTYDMLVVLLIDFASNRPTQSDEINLNLGSKSAQEEQKNDISEEVQPQDEANKDANTVPNVPTQVKPGKSKPVSKTYWAEQASKAKPNPTAKSTKSAQSEDNLNLNQSAKELLTNIIGQFFNSELPHPDKIKEGLSRINCGLHESTSKSGNAKASRKSKCPEQSGSSLYNVSNKANSSVESVCQSDPNMDESQFDQSYDYNSGSEDFMSNPDLPAPTLMHQEVQTEQTTKFNQSIQVSQSSQQEPECEKCKFASVFSVMNGEQPKIKKEIDTWVQLFLERYELILNAKLKLRAQRDIDNILYDTLMQD